MTEPDIPDAERPPVHGNTDPMDEHDGELLFADFLECLLESAPRDDSQDQFEMARDSVAISAMTIFNRGPVMASMVMNTFVHDTVELCPTHFKTPPTSFGVPSVRLLLEGGERTSATEWGKCAQVLYASMALSRGTAYRTTIDHVLSDPLLYSNTLMVLGMCYLRVVANRSDGEIAPAT